MAAPMYVRLETDLSDTEDFERFLSLPTGNLITVVVAMVGIGMLLWISAPLFENRSMDNPFVAVPHLLLVNVLMTIIMIAVQFWTTAAIVLANIAFPLLFVGLYQIHKRLHDGEAIGRSFVLFGVGFGLLLVTFTL